MAKGQFAVTQCAFFNNSIQFNCSESVVCCVLGPSTIRVFYPTCPKTVGYGSEFQWGTEGAGVT